MDPRLRPLLAFVVDLVLVAVFAAIGRASHGEAVGLVGLATTTWPFAAGWLVGWVLVVLVPRARARPANLLAGVLVWLPTVVGGMVLHEGSSAEMRTVARRSSQAAA